MVGGSRLSLIRFEKDVKTISDHGREFSTSDWWERFLRDFLWPPESAFEEATEVTSRKEVMPGTFPDAEWLGI